MAEMICPRCGRNFPPGSQFCSEDGVRLVEGAPTAAPGGQPAGNFYQPPPDPTAGPNPYAPQDPYGQQPGGAPPPPPYAYTSAPADAPFAVGEVIGAGWDLFKQNVGLFIGWTVLYFIISLVLQRMGNFGFLLQIVAFVPLALGGMYVVTFKTLRGQPTTFADFLGGCPNALPLILASLLVSLFSIIGFFMLIIPGIIVCSLYTLTLPLIIDQHMDFWPAMETSRKLVWDNLGRFLLLLFAFAGLFILGAIPLGLGLLVVLPLMFCTITVIYTRFFTPPPPPGYPPAY